MNVGSRHFDCLALMLLLVQGCGNSGSDPCGQVVCDRPPGDQCANDETLVRYQADGSCDPVTGECLYSHTDVSCEHGCRDGECLSGGLCDQVTCDDPPDDTCEDDQTLRVYEPSGSCDPDDGSCDYGFQLTPCEHGCSLGACAGLPGWGWIRVVEWNDTHSNAPFRTDQGIQAFFAAEPRCRWAMEHRQMGYCRLREMVSEGACSLAIVEGLSDWDCEPAGVSCDWANQECLQDGDGFACGDLPAVLDAGTVTLIGLGEEIVLQRLVDSQGEYTKYGLSDDLFAAGDPLTASVSGGELADCSLQARGVAPLEILDSQLDLVRGQPVVIGWVPADSGTRVKVALSAGSHFPHEYFGTVFCEADDEAGQIEIPAGIVTAFLDYTATIGIRRSSHLMRYTQASAGEIELLVGSARNLQLVLRH